MHIQCKTFAYRLEKAEETLRRSQILIHHLSWKAMKLLVKLTSIFTPRRSAMFVIRFMYSMYTLCLSSDSCTVCTLYVCHHIHVQYVHFMFVIRFMYSMYTLCLSSDSCTVFTLYVCHQIHVQYVHFMFVIRFMYSMYTLCLSSDSCTVCTLFSPKLLTHTTLKYFCTMETKGFFKFEIIINGLVSSFRFI